MKAYPGWVQISRSDGGLSRVTRMACCAAKPFSASGEATRSPGEVTFGNMTGLK